MHLKKEISLEELGRLINARPGREPGRTVSDISEWETASEKDIVYLADKKHIEAVNVSRAVAVLTSPRMAPSLDPGKTPLLAEDLEDSFIRLLDFFCDKTPVSFPRAAPPALVHPGAKIGGGVVLAPGVIVGENSSVGDGAVLHPQVCIGRNVRVGKNSVLMPHVTIYDGCVIGERAVIHSGVVIGSDGFGYRQKDGKNIKIPQIGHVIIEDDVEIGANTTIDRGTIGATVIHRGVKIDNLVQIAHNVEIGEGSVIASQTGISGSTKVGKNCILAGQAGIADHAVIEDSVIIGAQTGIPSRTVKSGEKFLFGSPGRPLMQAKRIEAVVSQLPELYQEFNALKKLIEEKLK